jgi:hypothetical protein
VFILEDSSFIGVIKVQSVFTTLRLISFEMAEELNYWFLKRYIFEDEKEK